MAKNKVRVVFFNWGGMSPEAEYIENDKNVILS